MPFLAHTVPMVVSEDAVIEPRPVATLTLAVRRCNLSAIDLVYCILMQRKKVVRHDKITLKFQ
jgi:hypothetical protein